MNSAFRVLRIFSSAAFAFCSVHPFVLGQEPVVIQVHADRTLAPLKPVWAYFGYDEPNYTYAPHGRELIGELAALSPVPVQIRTHNLLTTGDGTPALKWGSTNAYTEDGSGHPVYDWKIVDRILDTYLQSGAKPFVEIGFMPEALSTHPQPYRHRWPKDELYDYSVDAVRRALPKARVGGPATTGPASTAAAAFLKQFLEHCARGKNYATGKNGTPLDFISFHAKGSPQVVEGKVRMGLANNLRDVDEGLAMVASFPEFARLPVVLSESDPEGCAACSARVYPQNAYRNGTLYPAYTATAIRNMLDLNQRHGTNLAGILTWAFEFEDQPYFDGFRTLATNGVDKPVLNLFRMLGLMSGDRVEATSNGRVDVNEILKSGVRAAPDVDALAARSEHGMTVLLWNYHDNNDEAAPESSVQLNIAGLPTSSEKIVVHHYRIDRDHSNAYTLWKKLGSPQNPDAEEYAALKAAGQLQLLESPRWVESKSGDVVLSFQLPRQAVSLVKLEW